MAKSETPTGAQLYPVAEIYANSAAALGVKAEVVAGALYGSNKDQYTLDEVKSLIDKFKKREVK